MVPMSTYVMFFWLKRLSSTRVPSLQKENLKNNKLTFLLALSRLRIIRVRLRSPRILLINLSGTLNAFENISLLDHSLRL